MYIQVIKVLYINIFMVFVSFYSVKEPFSSVVYSFGPTDHALLSRLPDKFQ